MILFLIVLFFGTLAIGLPIYLSLIISGALPLLIFYPHIIPTVIVQRIVSGIDVFSLLSIPGFIFAAEMMGSGQISKRLIKFAKNIVGHLPGGLAIAVVLTCMIFGAISGSATASVVAIGALVYPALLEAGYGVGFSVGLILCSSTLAMLIPPGIAMILYSTLTNNSVGTVFIGGLGAGLAVGLALSIYCVYYSIRYKVPRERRATFKELLFGLKESFWALGLPVIVIGGIYSGYFTATEASALAVFYVIFVEAFIYRNLSFEKFWKLAAKTGADTAMIFMLIAGGSLLSWVLTISQVPQSIASSLGAFSDIVVLLLINAVFLIAGMFVDPNSAIIVLVPLLYGIGVSKGIDPIQLGIIITVNLAIGMLTPPFGLNLFVGSQVLKVSYTDTVKASIPFIIIMFLCLILVSFIPSISLWLPRLFGGI